MEQFDFAVFGNCATVQVLKFHEMPQVGRTSTAYNPFADEIFYGGCAFNVFYGLTRLGARCFPALTYADIRFRKKLYDICTEYGLPDYAIEGPPTASYSTCLILQDDHKNHITMMYHFGEDSDRQTVETAEHTILPEYFENCRMAVMVMGNPKTSFEVVRQVKAHGLPLAFSYRDDPLLLPRELLDVILPETSLLFTNEVEARSLSELYGMRDITGWFERGRAELIVTTLGRRGCIVYERDGQGEVHGIHVPATEAGGPCVDAVGAGDSFVAGFLYGYARGESPVVCAQYGSTASSFVIERDGSTTNLPTAGQVLERNRLRPDST